LRQNALLVIVLAVSLAAALLTAGCGSGSKIADPSIWATAAATTAATTTTTAQSAPTAAATWQANPPRSEPDTLVFRDIAVKSCLDEAEKQGESADEAQQYCTCAIDELLKNVTSDELTRIGQAGLSGNDMLPPDIDQKMMDAIMACNDKLTQ